eukprot:s79_g27.t1
MVFLQFYGIPPGEGTFGVYFALIAAFGLLGSWAQSGTNFPILSDIVPASDRSKVMAWERCQDSPCLQPEPWARPWPPQSAFPGSLPWQPTPFFTGAILVTCNDCVLSRQPQRQQRRRSRLSKRAAATREAWQKEKRKSPSARTSHLSECPNRISRFGLPECNRSGGTMHDACCGGSPH